MLRAFPLCTCCRYYPGTATAGCFFAHSHSYISLPRMCDRVGLCNVLFEDCSAFTHVTACTLAGPPKVNRYIKGFSYFVTSITAPIASGWSDDCRVGLSPTGKRRLITAHAHSGHSRGGAGTTLKCPNRSIHIAVSIKYIAQVSNYHRLIILPGLTSKCLFRAFSRYSDITNLSANKRKLKHKFPC